MEFLIHQLGALFGIISPRDSQEIRDILLEAEKLALSFPVDYVGVEHVFLSFRKLPPDHIISQTLAIKVDLAAFYSDLDARSRVTIDRRIPAKLPLTPRLKKILSHARKTARQNGHPEVTCFHILYSIGLERGSLPASILLTHFIAANPKYTSSNYNADLFVGYLAFSKEGKAPIWRMP